MTVLPSSLALTTIADGSNIVAADHRNNYTAIQAAANALIAALNSGTVGQTLQSSGPSAVTWASLGGLYRKTTTKTVNTTTTATDLLNGEITVGAGVLGTTGLLRLTAWGDWVNNTGGAAAGPRFQLVFGGTTLIDSNPGASSTANAQRGTWNLHAVIMNTGSASTQAAYMSFRVYAPGGFAAYQINFVGTGDYIAPVSGLAVSYGDGSGTSTVNTANSCALALNVINGSANAAYETKLFGATVEVV